MSPIETDSVDESEVKVSLEVEVKALEGWRKKQVFAKPVVEFWHVGGPDVEILTVPYFKVTAEVWGVSSAAITARKAQNAEDTGLSLNKPG